MAIVQTKPRPSAESVSTSASPEWDWPRIEGELNRQGDAVVERLIGAQDCAMLAGLYDAPRPAFAVAS